MEVSKEILNHQNIATIHSGLLMTLTYDSEIYQVLNGTKDWSLQIIVTDMETGKELENIKFPDEDYNLSIETWDNFKNRWSINCNCCCITIKKMEEIRMKKKNIIGIIVIAILVIGIVAALCNV